jgi:hypothetical protein
MTELEDKIEELRQYWRRKYGKNIVNKLEVFVHYCKGEPRCSCCGERTLEFLTLDHFNDNGKEHRIKLEASNLYTWAIKNNFPEDIVSVVCCNCHYARHWYGQCPHKSKNRKV